MLIVKYYEYNDKGKEKKIITESKGASRYTGQDVIEFNYNDHDQLVKRLYYHETMGGDKNYISDESFEYDSTGRISAHFCNDRSLVTYVYDFEYSGMFIRSKETHWPSPGNGDFEEVLETTVNEDTPNGLSPYQIYRYTYRDEPDSLRSVMLPHDKKVLSVSYLNENFKPIYQVSENFDPEKRYTVIYKTAYNSKGDISKVEYLDNNDGNMTPTTTIRYEYDQDGHLEAELLRMVAGYEETKYYKYMNGNLMRIITIIHRPDLMNTPEKSKMIPKSQLTTQIDTADIKRNHTFYKFFEYNENGDQILQVNPMDVCTFSYKDGKVVQSTCGDLSEYPGLYDGMVKIWSILD